MYVSDTIRDVYWTFVLPAICLFSLITNTINIIVFYSIKSRNFTYKCMLYNSIADQLYLVIVFFVFIIRCGQFCEIKNSYFAMFYAHYIYMYVANSISLFCILIEISILIYRYNYLTNKIVSKKINKNVLFLCLLILCFVYHLPQLTTFEIKQVNLTRHSNSSRESVYFRENVTQFKSVLTRNLLAIQTGTRLILILIMIYFLQRLSCLLFKKYESIIGINYPSSKYTSSQSNHFK